MKNKHTDISSGVIFHIVNIQDKFLCDISHKDNSILDNISNSSVPGNIKCFSDRYAFY
jgi:hypothetical protein